MLVIPRTIVLSLVAAAAVLLVALAVLVGGYALASLAQDAVAATVLWWLSMALLMTLIGDLVLLVGVLALRELDQRDDE